jgi:nicotinamide riboside kinase
MASFNVAILGAESTGKTTLARAVVEQLLADGKPAVLVPEYLRTWCDAHGRTPEAHEQAHIGSQQARQLSDAQNCGPTGCMIITDTSPLLTAVYSDVYFNDASLYKEALAYQRTYHLTLLTGLDIAWVEDGIQRDGETVRRVVDQRLRDVLAKHAIAYATVYGQGPARTHCALQAIAYSTSDARTTGHSNWKWTCEKCSDADCEHRLFTRLTN